MKKFLFYFILCLPAISMAKSGKVVFAAGSSVVSGTAFEERKVEKGEAVISGNLYSTRNGILQIKFDDGGFISLKPNSTFLVEEYRYDPDTPEKNSAKFNLQTGELRTKSGKVGKHNPNHYAMKTPVATIGIRGTTYRLIVIENDFGESLSINMGEEGGISIVAEGIEFQMSALQVQQIGGVQQIESVFQQGGTAQLQNQLEAALTSSESNTPVRGEQNTTEGGNGIEFEIQQVTPLQMPPMPPPETEGNPEGGQGGPQIQTEPPPFCPEGICP